MASKARDDFNRPNAATLGVADTGQQWVAHRGSASISSGRAVPAGNRPGDIHTVNVGAGGGDALVSMGFPDNGGGQALYFRVVNANYWWRLARRQYTYPYTYQSGTTPETYGYVGNGTYRYEPAGPFQESGVVQMGPSDPKYGFYTNEYYSFDARVNAYLNRIDYEGTQKRLYRTRVVYENQSYVKTGGGEPIYSTGYATATEVLLEKCVNGAVQRIRTAEHSPSNLVQMQVNLNGDVITATANGTGLWTVTDPAYKTASLHGIGFAESSETGNTLGIEYFEATPFVLTTYVPPVML